jgi:hypothetical protein
MNKAGVDLKHHGQPLRGTGVVMMAASELCTVVKVAESDD